MEDEPKIVYVFRGSGKKQHLALLAEGKLPRSFLRGMDYLRDAGKVCAYVETDTLGWRGVVAVLKDHDVVFLSDGLLAFPLLNLFFRKKIHYLDLSGSTLLRYKKGFKRLLFILFLRMVDSIICIAKIQVRDLAGIGVVGPKVTLIKFGVDTEFFDEGIDFRARASGGYIVSIGRDRGRDFDALFALATQLPDEHFIIATSPSMIPESANMPSNIKVRYNLSPVEVRELYRGAKCCIITLKEDDTREGSDCTGQTTIQETLSAGLPVFATHRAWLDDYYEPFVHYIPLPQGDVPAMTEVVVKYLRAPDLLYATAQKGQEETKRELTIEKFAEGLYRIFLNSHE